MPLYVYKHPDKENYIEVVQTMKEEHVYVDEDGVSWKRVFVNPQLSCSSSIDPFDNKAFINKTGEMKGSYGDMLDLSKEMSEKRKEVSGGKDPVKEAYFEKYTKERKGAKHPSQLKEGFENKNIKITYD